MPQQINQRALPLMLAVLAGCGALGSAGAHATANEHWQCSDSLENGVRVRRCKPAVTASEAMQKPPPGELGAAQPRVVPPTVPATAPTTSPATSPAISPLSPPPIVLPTKSAAPANPAATATRAPTSSSMAAPQQVATTDQPVAAQPECSAMPASAPVQADSSASAALDLQNRLPLAAEADEVTLQGNVAQFSGRAEFTRGGARLQAESASFNRETQTIELREGVIATTPFAEVSGEYAEVNLANNASLVENARYRLLEDGMHGAAASISIDPDQRVTIENGSYTRCPPERELWRVEADSIKLNPATGSGSAHNARLRINNVPVLYVPYARFPIDDQRKSGLLFPRLSDSDDGLDFTLPYYFNIAPNIDATLSPRYKQNSGYLT
ncbi:MAG: hypothetical protein HKO71_02975, partial [Pseudomonadales bacterium]|nr:hypothetical protein [Pseudomonadales bacterium]